MNDEQAESLGLRALARGIPWVDGLLDGSKYKREGAEDACGCCPAGSGCWYYEHGTLSWPDFRDPVTEAWLVAWASRQAWQYGPDIHEEHSEMLDSDPWQIVFGDGDIIVHGQTRAEAWLNALEQLGGGK